MGRQEDAARLFGVLSDPVRLEILSAIARKGCCVSILQAQTGRSQPNISQHLRVLRASGLVETRREGRKICYSLSNPKLRELLLLAKDV